MEKTMNRPGPRYAPAVLLTTGILTVFVLRTLLAASGGDPPRLADLFIALTLAGSLAVLIPGVRVLHRSDWIAAACLGGVAGGGMVFATLFTPYPIFGVALDNLGQAAARGLCVTLAALGGLVVMRQGGPVQILAANGEWKKSIRAILLGLAVGLPLAVVNVFALQLADGRGIAWQNPLAALLDALQPGFFEEVIYRFALWGLLWLALRSSLPGQAAALAGLLATLVHNYAHFDELFVQSPLTALGMGLVIGIVWGLPPFFLARRRGLESAIAFHWIQDVTRFAAGF